MVRQRPHHRGQVYSAPLTHQQGIELQEVCSCLSVLFVCLYLYQLYSPLRHLRYDREGERAGGEGVRHGSYRRNRTNLRILQL